MLQNILQNIQNELIASVSKKDHPFKYFSLATLNENIPTSRTVVLRDTFSDFSLVFYTDSRTEKVRQILNNPQVSALFYNPDDLIQLRLEGTAEIEADQKVLKNHWNSIPEKSRKDYITKRAPGSQIKNPDDIDYINNDNHFCMVTIKTNKIEYLQLKRPNHIRAQFHNTENSWKGTFLVP